MTSMGGAVPMPPDVLHAAGAVREVIGGNKIVRVRQRSVVAGGVLDGAAVQRQLVGPDFQTVTRPVAHRNRVLEHHIGPAAIAAAVTGLPHELDIFSSSCGAPATVTSSLKVTVTWMASPRP